MAKPKVAIVMGSDSDWPTMEPCLERLQAFGIETTVQVASAHRSPAKVHTFAQSARDEGYAVIIAAAGMSAALAGAIAAVTTLPVIGVPIDSGTLDGLDALLSTVQVPPGIPVATVAIGKAGATNAAVLAAQIIGLSDADVAAKLADYKQQLAASVEKKNAAIQERIQRGS